MLEDSQTPAEQLLLSALNMQDAPERLTSPQQEVLLLPCSGIPGYSQPNHAYSAQLEGVRLEGIYTLEQAKQVFPRHSVTQIKALCDNCKAYLKSGEK